MRGFTQPYYSDITLRRGAEALPVRVYPIPLLLLTRLDVEYPAPADDDKAATRAYWARRGEIIAAACLQDEELPALPTDSSQKSWARYRSEVHAVFAAAGLSPQHIDQVVTAALALRNPVQEQAGNASAPAGAPTAT